MSRYEKLLTLICLVMGTLLLLTTQMGLSYFSKGEPIRALFYLAVSVFTIGGWLRPFLKKSMADLASRGLILLLISWSAYGYLRENFLHLLPRL